MHTAAYRIAVIGAWSSVMGFRALGLDTYPVTDAEQAKDRIRQLAKEDYAVIYLTEQFAQGMEAFLERYQKRLCPAVILIPGENGSLGIGLAHMKIAIERAVGADILS